MVTSFQIGFWKLHVAARHAGKRRTLLPHSQGNITATRELKHFRDTLQCNQIKVHDQPTKKLRAEFF
jgi:hypothetical protein